MILAYSKKKFDWLISWIENWSGKKYWSLKVTLLSGILSLFTAFPSYDLFFKDLYSNAHHWKAISSQINHPLSQRNYETISHESNISFRLSVPVIAHFTGLKNQGIVFQIIALFLIQLAALCIFFYVLSLIFFTISKDRTSATLLTFSFALIYPGNSLALDIWGCMDVVGYCFLALAMVAKRPWGIFSFTLLASFTDERAMVASCLVFLWHVLKDGELKESITMRKFVSSASLSVLAAWLFYFILRSILIQHFNFVTNTYSLSAAPVVIKEAVSNIPIGILSGLEGWWLIVLLSIMVLGIQKNWVYLFLYCGGMCVVGIVAFCVLDITRSMAYIFPAAIIGAFILQKTESPKNLRYLSLIVLLICLFPTYYVGGQHTAKWLYPFPLQALRMLADSKTFSLTF